MLMYANVFLMGLSLVKQVVVTPGLLNSFYPNLQWYLKRHKLEERFLTWISILTALKLPPQVCVGVSLHLDFSLNSWPFCPPATDGVRGKKMQLPSNASDFWTINILTHYSCSISHGFMVRKYQEDAAWAHRILLSSACLSISSGAATALLEMRKYVKPRRFSNSGDCSK